MRDTTSSRGLLRGARGKTSRRSVLAGLACSAAFPAAGRAAYPDRPVRLVVQVAAGSSIDIAARMIGEQLSRRWGQQVVVFNQAGAGGAIAVRTTTSAPPDGTTLLFGASSIFLVLPEQQPNLGVDTLEPIGFVSEQPMALLVAPSLGIKSLPDLLAYAKTQPGGINCGVITRGGFSHLTAEYLRMRTGIELGYVYYPGSQQALNDVTTGRVPMMIETLSGVLSGVSGGLVEMIAVAGAARLANYPQVATVAETVPDFRASAFTALAAPAGTPAPIIAKIAADLKSVLADPDLARKFADQGSTVRSMDPAELAAHIRQQRQLWGPILKQVGMQPQ